MLKNIESIFKSCLCQKIQKQYGIKFQVLENRNENLYLLNIQTKILIQIGQKKDIIKPRQNSQIKNLITVWRLTFPKNKIKFEITFINSKFDNDSKEKLKMIVKRLNKKCQPTINFIEVDGTLMMKNVIQTNLILNLIIHELYTKISDIFIKMIKIIIININYLDQQFQKIEKQFERNYDILVKYLKDKRYLSQRYQEIKSLIDYYVLTKKFQQIQLSQDNYSQQLRNSTQQGPSIKYYGIKVIKQQILSILNQNDKSIISKMLAQANITISQNFSFDLETEKKKIKLIKKQYKYNFNTIQSYQTQKNFIRQNRRNPNILQYYLPQQNNDSRIIYVQVADKDLEQQLKSSIEFDRASKLAINIFQNIYYLYDSLGVHSDIKPRNIVIHKGKTYLIDFEGYINWRQQIQKIMGLADQNVIIEYIRERTRNSTVGGYSSQINHFTSQTSILSLREKALEMCHRKYDLMGLGNTLRQLFKIKERHILQRQQNQKKLLIPLFIILSKCSQEKGDNRPDFLTLYTVLKKMNENLPNS